MADPGVDLSGYAHALADRVEAALPGWVEACVTRIYTAFAGAMTASVTAAASAAGDAALTEIGPRLRVLLDLDVDEQRTTPLAVVREAVAYPTRVLADAGVPPVVRDEVDEAMFPEDIYGLTPASLADLDPGLREPALAWGAAKAWVHKQRHGR